jgi:hypothetical protein
VLDLGVSAPEQEKTMEPKNLDKYFNCGQTPSGIQAYNGKHLGFFAVADHIDDGYEFAKELPIEQARGLDVFERKPLPQRVMFVYPEHTLVPWQQQQFIRQLIVTYPDVREVIVITTSSVIISDAVTCEVIRSSRS